MDNKVYKYLDKGIVITKLSNMRKFIGYVLIAIIDLMAMSVLFVIGTLYFLANKVNVSGQARIKKVIFGSDPIINNKYWSRAIQLNGFDSKTIVDSIYSINSEKDFDEIYSRSGFLRYLRGWVVLLKSLKQADWIVMPFSGFYFGRSQFGYKLNVIFRLFNTRSLIIPYGSDVWVYRRLRSLNRFFGLMASYPEGAKSQRFITKRLDYWCEKADAIVPGTLATEGIGRWTVLVPSVLCIDTREWKPSLNANLNAQRIKILHSPNHRGYKGTEYLIEAVDTLQAEGLEIELNLLEGVSNEEVKKILQNETDILVEQLLSGHGMSAVEGMASGVVVVANLEENHRSQFLDRFSFFSECPIVSATPESITDVLRTLYFDQSLRQELGRLSREYAEKYHSFDFFYELFNEVISAYDVPAAGLETLYHPIMGKFKSPNPLKPPLTNHRLKNIKYS